MALGVCDGPGVCDGLGEMEGDAARVGVRVGVGVLVGTLVEVLVGAGIGVDVLDGVLVGVCVGRAVAVDGERGALAAIAGVALTVGVLASVGVIGKATDGASVGVGDGAVVAVGAAAVGVSASARVVTSEVGLSAGSASESFTCVDLASSAPINAIRTMLSASTSSSLSDEGRMLESPTRTSKIRSRHYTANGENRQAGRL